MKVVVNKCFGGFGLSLKGQKRLAELKGKEIFFYKQTQYDYRDGIDEYTKITDLNNKTLFTYAMAKDLGEKINNLPDDCWFKDNGGRDDKCLIQVVEELGEEANGDCANLKIVEIPNDVKWVIEEYDGSEWVAEVHRTWD